MKMRLKLTHRYDINRRRPRRRPKYTGYKIVSISQQTSEAYFMKELSNSDAELKKVLLVKKRVFV